MRVAAHIITAVLGVLVLVSPQAQLLSQTGPASEAGAINDDLKDTYSAILSSDGNATALDVAALQAHLTSDLTSLYAVETSIAALGPGLGDADIMAAAQRSRALAWIHGWAILSRLTIETQRLNCDPGFHDRLLGLGDPGERASSLGLLLAIYNQIQTRDGTADPLQHLLTDDPELIYELSYQEAWRGDRPATITQNYYIPSSSDLTGNANSNPALDRHLLSLWGIVNSNLDAWHQYQALPAREGVPEGTLSAGLETTSNGRHFWIQADTSTFAPLTQWLDELQHNDSLSAFGPQTSQLTPRLHKMALYLSARQQLADPVSFKAAIHGLSDTRINLSDPTSVQPVGELLEAATPLSGSGPQPETIYEASIWLRYLVLLSYQDEGAALVNSAAANGIDHFWSSFHLPGPFLLTKPAVPIPSTPNKSALATAGPYLRWNCWPTAGTTSSLIADLTIAAYESIQFDSAQMAAEKVRFSSSYAPLDRATYAKTLAANLTPITKQAIPLIESYFGPTPTTFPNLSTQPSSLTSHSGQWFSQFHASSSSAEQSRLSFDLTMLYQHLTQTAQLNTVILNAYNTGNATTLAVSLKTLGGAKSLSGWNLYSLPNKSFEQYISEFDSAIKRLNALADQATADQDLRSLFYERQALYQSTKLKLEAARLGSQMAAQASIISATYKKIADYNIQIQQLDEKIKDLQYQGDLSSEQASQLTLTYAIQKRNLAAAKVEALVQASQQANQLVGQASTQLLSVKQQLLSTARDIAAEKAAERSRSLIDGIINVVGLALAPFTSGASLSIAAEATQVINTIDQVTHTNWSNFDSVVATVNIVAGQTRQVLSLAASFDSSDVNKAVGDVSKFLDSATSTINTVSADVATVTNQAKDVYDAIKSLPNPNDISTFASALASGIPLTFDQTTHALQLELDSSELIPQDPALQTTLSDLVNAGAFFVNTAQMGKNQYAALPSLSGQALRTALVGAMDSTIQTLPTDLLKKPLDQAQNAIGVARDNLHTAINGFTDQESQMMAEALASGAIFIKDSASNKIAAVQGETGPEVTQFKSRIAAFQKQIATKAVTDIVTSIQKTNDDINNQAQVFINNKDDGGLTNFANTVVPSKIDSLRSGLDNLQIQIQLAQGELEDKKTEVSIASYQEQTAEDAVAAGKLGVEEGSIMGERVGAQNDAALADVERTKLLKQASNVSEEAEKSALEAAALSLRRTYLDCMAAGFNPLAHPADGSTNAWYTNFDQFGGTSLIGVVIGSPGASSTEQKVLVEEAADGLSGMAQWLTLLNLSSSGDAKTQNLAVYVTLTNILSRTVEEDGKGWASSLQSLADDFKTQYSTVTNSKLNVFYTKLDKVDGKSEILWFDQMEPGEASYWKSLVPPSTRPSLLGFLSFSFSVDNGPADPLVFRPPDPVEDRNGFAYYINTGSSFVSVPDGANVNSSQLAYIIVPPANSTANTGQAVVSNPALAGPSVNQFNSASEDLWIQQQKDQLSKWPEISLSGAIGVWRIYFWNSSSLSPQQVADLRANLLINVRVPYYRVGFH